MDKLKISTKILIYFLLVSLIPAFITVYVLVNSAKTELLHAASSSQQQIANNLVYKVNTYLTDKVNYLTALSQVDSSNDVASSDLNQQLAVILNQDPDMQRIALVAANGQDSVAFNRNGQDFNLKNEASTDAFKAVNFLSGKAFVSSVSYDSHHDPIITIAVPILTSNFAQHLDNLKSANFGKYNNYQSVQGSVIAVYNMGGIWNSLLSTKVGKQGYAYVVDGLGNLVAYPNTKFLSDHPKLTNVQAVNNFIYGNFSTKSTKSETGLNVISTPRNVAISGWGVIVEEPVNDIYSTVYAYEILATVIGLADLAFCIVLSFYFTKQLLVPIRQLSKGAKAFGEGNFDKKIQVNTHDELHELAETFNGMGASIKALINDLKSNNVNLELEQSKLNNIINSVSDGVIALNNKGEIVSANPPAAKLIGKNVKEIQGKPMRELYRLQTEDKPFIVSLDEIGVSQYNDLELPKTDGMSYLSLVVSVISHEDNEIAAIITINDQTQSRELDFMKLDFVAIAAHELRTPLTVVRGYLDLINPEAIRKLTLSGLENFQKAIEGTDQLRDLINKLLNIARIERGEMEIFIEKLNLTKMLKENVRQHNSTAVLKEQTLTFDPEDIDKPVFVPGDPASITEVLNNLIGNAIKYTGRGGMISVKMTTDKDTVKVEVIDNGPGVPEELRNRLFTKFYRAERSLIAGTRGTGLGLFISKTIIELQRGTIGIEPDSGHGSVFYFTLPVYDADKYDKLVSKDKPLGGINGWFKKRNARRR